MYEEWLVNPKGAVNHKHNITDTIKQFTLEGEFIKEWNNVPEICNTLNIKGSSSINECLNGKGKTVAGFLWSYSFKCPIYDNKKPRHNLKK